MTRDEFRHLVGDRIAHLSPPENAPSIRARGLWPAADLAVAAGVSEHDLVLRQDPLRLDLGGKSVRLNHQRPLHAGRDQSFLDGHSPESWSRQLDRRVFFWPRADRARDSAFAKSLDGGQPHVLDSALFFDAFAPDIWLSPINSGNATRKPSWRGDWLYVSVDRTVDEFLLGRVGRGLVKLPDRVVEISIRQRVPPDLLARLTAT